MSNRTLRRRLCGVGLFGHMNLKKSVGTRHDCRYQKSTDKDEHYNMKWFIGTWYGSHSSN